MARPTTPAEADAQAMQVQTITNFVLSQQVRHGALMDALSHGSFGGDADGNGYHDETTGEWIEYMRYGVDAYDSGKGMAP